VVSVFVAQYLVHRVSDMVQILANGLISGLSIGLLALASIVVYLPTGIFRIDAAGVYTLVPLIFCYCVRAGWP